MLWIGTKLVTFNHDLERHNDPTNSVKALKEDRS